MLDGPTFDPRYLPSYSDANANTDKAGPIMGGLGAGIHQLLGLGSSALEGVANLEGADKVAALARGWADTQNRISGRIRPDLDIAPWQQGGASVLPWAEYQVGKLVPTLAGFVGATALAPEAAVPTAIARGLPAVLGGLAEDATPAAAKAASKFILGGGLFAGTTGFGQAIQSADQKPGGATATDSAQALAESPLYAAAGILTPGFLKTALGEGGNVFARIAKKSLEGSAVGAFQSGATTALDQTFRPDLSARDKMHNIMDATVTGAAVAGLAGGIAGGLPGMREIKRADANSVTTDDLDKVTSAVDPQAQVSVPRVQRYSPPLLGTDTISNPKEGSLRWAQPYDQGLGEVPGPADGFERGPPVQGPVRPFADAPIEELQKISRAAENYLAGLPEDHTRTERDVKVQNQLALVNDELSRRNPPESSGDVRTAPAGAVEPSPTDTGAAGGTQVAPAPAKTFKDNLADLTKGLRLPARFVADINGAKDANDLLSKVHDQIFGQQDARPTIQKFAQRLGLLDDQLNPTQLAETLGARKEEQQASKAPVDEAFQQKWAALTAGKNLPKTDVVRDLPVPANEQEAQRTVYNALTADRGEVSNRLEQIAQEVGLLDSDKKPTDLMVKFSRQDIPLKEAVDAAQAAGLKGAEVSQFDRGARWTEDKLPTFDDPREAMSFIKGREWSNPETLSEPETQAAIKDMGLGDHFEAGQEIPDLQRGMRELNSHVDEQFPTTKFPTENARLKELVTKGDITTKDQITEAVRHMGSPEDISRYLATGHGALLGDAAPPVRPSDPNVKPTPFGDTYTPDRSITRTTAADVSRADLRQQQAAGQLGAENQKLSARQAVIAHELTEGLKSALQNGDVKSGDYMYLRQAVKAGDFDKVKDALNGLNAKPYMHINGRDVSTGRDWIAAADVLGRQNVFGGGAQGLMRNLRELGGPIGNMAARFEKYVPRDIKVDILTPDEMRRMWTERAGDALGNRVPVGHYDPAARTIALSTEMDHPSVALHEIVHAITLDHITNKTPIGREMIAMFNKFKNSGPASDYAFTNAHEFMSEFLARQQVRDYIKNAQPTVFQRVWNAIRKMLGMPSKDYVERILKLAERAGAEPVSRSDLNSPPIVARTVDERVKDVINVSEKIVRRDSALGVARKTGLGWATVHDIAQFWGKKWFDPAKFGEAFRGMINPVMRYAQHLGEKQAIVARMAQMMTTARDSVQHLMRIDKEAGKALIRLMRLSEFGLDPTKPWEEQIAKAREGPNAANLQKMHAEAAALFQEKLVRSKDGLGARAYRNLRDVNDTQMLSQMAVTLHSQVATDSVASAELAHFAENPMDRFMRAQQNEDFNPATARDWWSKELQAQLNALDNHFRQHESALDGLGNTTKESRLRDATINRLDPLKSRVKNIKQTITQLEEAPYFHLGRFGNYFVGWHVTSQEALGKVADYLEAEGFKGVISRESEKVNTYMRLDNQQQQGALREAIEKFDVANPGMIEPNHTVSGERTSRVIRNSFADQWFERMVEDINANDEINADAKKVAVNALHDLHLDLMPENSISRVMTHREGVPGYDPDMLRAFEHRANVGINALAGMVISPKISRAFTDMRTLEGAAQHSPSSRVPLSQQNGMTNVIDELSRREEERPQWPQTKLLDQLRAVNHAWFLGGSISYGLVNMSQLGATLLPELGARHGFVKSAKMMASVTPDAMRIIRAIWNEGRNVSLSRAMDAVVTRSALDKAGIRSDVAEFIMRVANSGELDIGGPSRELMRAAEGRGTNEGGVRGGVDNTLRYASAIGYYTETASRLIAALSSYHLDGIKDPEKAAERAVYVLKETMWDYSQANQGREFGKKGFLGKYTPLATAFMQYNAQLTGKLYRETYEAIKGETPAERAEARRFLAMHLTSMTVLAGSLGLPMVTVLAATIDRLKDLFDDDGKPSDVRAEWRNMLADAFGKDAGELLSRGAPRAAGIDLSSRLGEQDLLPFSRMIADRRNFKDSIKDMQARSWGAPASMVANAFQGGEAISNGDFLGGMQRMLPNALAAPTKAYQMTEKGFVDASGHVLPMKPSTWNIIAATVGFNSSTNAEYSEARQTQAVRKGLLVRQATNLRGSLAQAVVGQDRDTARDALDQIKQFNEANPGYAISGSEIAGAIRRQAQQAALAKTTRTPLGISPKDIGAQRLTHYANY